MIKLETERLRIFPLDYAQLQTYLKTHDLLEKELGLKPHKRLLSDELVEALEQTILPTVAAAKEDYLFSTLWAIVLKSENVLVASMCFKGKPNEKGEIELAYGTFDDFQRKGYMTEAVEAFLAWAFGQEGVKTVVAETDFDNDASHTVLKRNGFETFLQLENMRWWRLERK